MPDIETLRFIWWVLLGVLLIGFAITDGFDMGVAALMPFVTRDEVERRIVLNTIGPIWEGNQVWIILGAGAIFAAWPYLYAVAFSGFYLLILLLLLTMGISRPVSFKYRSKLPNLFWRRFWDWVVFVGGVVPALIFGILMGNVLSGAPFYLDSDLRISYSGSFADLFHPFALWCGLTSLVMLTMHGGLFLAIKTNPPISTRAKSAAKAMAFCLILLFALAGVWVAYGLNGFEVLTGADPLGYSNPLHKTVGIKLGGWLNNYVTYPLTIAAPLCGFLGALGVIFSTHFTKPYFAFVCSSLSIFGIIATVGVSTFPFLLPSSTHFSSSLLIWDASSSQLTLLVMLASVIVFMPIILLYTSWVYYALRGKVSRQMIEKDEHHTNY